MNARHLYERIFDDAATLVRDSDTDDVTLARGIVAVIGGKPAPDWAQSAPQALYRLAWLLHVHEIAYDSVGLVTMALAVSSMEAGAASLAETRDNVMMTVDYPRSYLAMESDRVVDSMEHSANVSILDIDDVNDLSALVWVPLAQLRDPDADIQGALDRCSETVRDVLEGQAKLAPERLLERARAVGARDRLDEALGYCDEVVGATVDGPVAIAAEALAIELLFNAKADDEAEERIERVLEDHQEGTGQLYYWRARLGEERGHDEQALTDFEEALRRDPADPTTIQLALANLHSDRGDHAAAIASLTTGLDGDPDNARLLARRGNCYSHAGDYAAAIADLDQAIRSEPKTLDFLHDRAVSHMIAEQHTPALTDLNAVLAIDSDHDMALQNRGVVQLQLGQLADAEADFDRSYQLNDRRLTALHGRAKARVEQDKHELALPDLNVFLQRVQHELGAYLLRARCHEAADRAPLAVLDYLLVLRHSPEENDHTTAAQQALARLDYQGPRTYPLPTSPHTAAVSEAGPPEAHALLGQGKAQTASDPERSLEIFGELVECFPEFFPGYLNRAMLYVTHNMFEQAESDLHKAAQFGPKTDFYHTAWGEFFGKQGQAEKAVQAYTEVIRLFDLDPKTYLLRAIQLQNLDRGREALADLERGLMLSPADADILFTMAGTYSLHLQDHPSAIATYDRLLQLFPKDAQALANRGVSRLTSGDRAAAVRDWAEAIELEPFYALPYFQRGLLGFLDHRDDDSIMWRAFVDLCTAVLVAPQGWSQKDAALDMVDELRPRLSQTPAAPHTLLRNAAGLAKSHRADDIKVAEQLVVEMMTAVPRSATFSAFAGELALQDNDKEYAQKMFDKALEFDANDADAHWGLANCDSTPENSLPHLLAAKSHRHQSAHWPLVDLLDRLANVYKTLGDHVLRLPVLEECVALAPQRDDVWFALGLELDDAGQVKRSIDAYTHAIEIDDEHWEYWYNRACEYARDNDPDSALKDLEHAVQSHEQARKSAATEEYFANLREHPEFVRLVQRAGS